MPLTFGPFILPHVLTIQTTKAYSQIDRRMPMRNVSYRAAFRDLGQTLKVSGEIRETTIGDAAAKIELLRRLADRVQRTVDLKDGYTEPFNALLCNLELEIAAGKWLDGRYQVPYLVTLLEVA